VIPKIVPNFVLLDKAPELDPEPKRWVSAKWKPDFPWLTNAERVCAEITLKQSDEIIGQKALPQRQKLKAAGRARGVNERRGRGASHSR
jgi:hypothetical protein